ncbi:MFS transporter [Nonomuraea sp. NPDC049655]|uniref:MFS transporter n=1 Tax=Nonomuraea sp. NPDC049655 TaxID=3364355 RepID=UPI00379DBFB4
MAGRGTITLCYGLTGVTNAVWAATLPATDARLGLGPGGLGTLLMVLAAGSLVAMPVAGRLCDRWSGGGLLRVCAPAAALALAGPALAAGSGPLMVSAALLGVLFGLLNVALSVQAVAVERGLGRPIMATVHGTWTLGAVAGGALVTAALRAGADVRVLMLVGATALTAAMAAVGGAAMATTRATAGTTTGTTGGTTVGTTVGGAARTTVGAARGGAGGAVGDGAGGVGGAEGRGAEGRGVARLRPGVLAMLGVIGAAAFVAEGAATDWAGVHATRVLGADPATGSLVYTVFFVAMTLVRFAGDAVRTRLGVRVTIRLAGATATAGYGLVLLAGVLPVGAAARLGCAMAGWALSGAGVAVVWPVVASLLGTVGGAARGLSAVTTVSYGGGLVGPALIGYVATTASLPLALVIPAALALLVAVAAPPLLDAVVTTAAAADHPAAHVRAVASRRTS